MANDDWTDEEITLVDLINRTIDRGVMLHGDAILSVADVDLVELTLDICLRAVEGGGKEPGDGPRGALE